MPTITSNENGIDITKAPYCLFLGGWMCNQSKDGIFVYDMRHSKTITEN
ncbi:hypothetical protein N5853_03355 [Bartonella sp. HY329]|nr:MULTISPECIES: hypothetical protein [unclassified Bartonella]UXM95678.1 hypothetical protein N5853_03355 [Bartonella sp. HY329]UXN10003.1 hypothetical protein N5852_03365 [Bartonella sp. HY328]